MRDDDRELVESLGRPEPGAVEILVDGYAGWIFRAAARVLGDRRDAEEVTKDVLMTVVRKIGTFKGESRLSSWLYRITANAAYERVRGRSRRAEVPLDAALPVFDAAGRHVGPVVDWSREIEDPAVASEVRDALKSAIAELPEDYRMVLVLRDVEGMRNEEVARALELTVAAVKSRLHRARLFVRHRVGSRVAPAA